MVLLTVSEAARKLKTNKNFVYNQIRSGNLEAMRMGNIKIRDNALDDFIIRWESKNKIGGFGNV